MRKYCLAVIIMFSAALHAQTSCTPGGGVNCSPNLDLWLLPQHYQLWGTPWNDNANAIDAFSQTVILKNPTVSQTINQPNTTFFNIDAPLIYGPPGSLLFGPGPNNFDSALTRSGSGIFSLDTTLAGNGQGTLKLRSANFIQGFQINGGAILGHVICGNGSLFTDCATLPGNFFYQALQNPVAGAFFPQEKVMTFASAFNLADSPGSQSTIVDIDNSGVTPGTYTNATVTVNAKGFVTGATSGGGGNTFKIQNAEVGGCTVNSGGSYSACTIPVSWGVPFSDTAYTVACTGFNPTSTSGEFQAYISGYEFKTTTGITVVVASGGTAFPQGFGAMDCTAFHQ